MRNFSLFAAAVVVSMSMGSALAATPPAAEAPLVGDAAAGSTKAAVCTACHGVNGNSVNPLWPVLAGQNAAYSSDQVKRFKAGHRVDPLMSPIAMTLSDQDIADVSAYFATQTPTGSEADPSYWKAGEALYRGGDAKRGLPACIACHGPVGRGVPAAGYPAVQAQHSVYTVKQLEAYATDVRYTKDAAGKVQAGPNAQIMTTIATRLTPEDRRNLASYIQGMR